MNKKRFVRKDYDIWDNVKRKEFGIWDTVKDEEFYSLHNRCECDDICDILNEYENKFLIQNQKIRDLENQNKVYKKLLKEMK